MGKSTIRENKPGSSQANNTNTRIQDTKTRKTWQRNGSILARNIASSIISGAVQLLEKKKKSLKNQTHNIS